MSHQKGLLLPLWMENTIDLVVTVIVLRLRQELCVNGKAHSVD
ncbi:MULTISPECIES: hypothetical protein [Enterococcus]|nr:hypothetical protein [Enterococcus hirae]MDV7772637.1 hypothetical protein [Enterococcus hirae]